MAVKKKLASLEDTCFFCSMDIEANEKSKTDYNGLVVHACGPCRRLNRGRG